MADLRFTSQNVLGKIARLGMHTVTVYGNGRNFDGILRCLPSPSPYRKEKFFEPLTVRFGTVYAVYGLTVA